MTVLNFPDGATRRRLYDAEHQRQRRQDVHAALVNVQELAAAAVNGHMTLTDATWAIDRALHPAMVEVLAADLDERRP